MKAMGRKITAMAATDKTIPIHDAALHAACGSCGQSPCQTSARSAIEAPQLSGPTDELRRLLTALAPPMGFASDDLKAAGLVRSLQVQPGEVSLTLAVSRHCGGQDLAELAFQTLRALLPDTDIYVTTEP
jgi:hypothetical protein